ncbi:hypothetical protein AOQ84DRAFT_186033 [Glonium stellatum]|uniref:Secreted protein n=1 Tax=Glonium stellatum TaxID=574774 RepID=A0A8E2F737_9PEZI|nr:hypothetical protein AOQ84DRAFT_186033 [Glonium stellatum]
MARTLRTGPFLLLLSLLSISFESFDPSYFVQAHQRRISHEAKAFSFGVSLLFLYRFQRIPFSCAYLFWRGVLFLWSGAGGNDAWFLRGALRGGFFFPCGKMSARCGTLARISSWCKFGLSQSMMYELRTNFKQTHPPPGE